MRNLHLDHENRPIKYGLTGEERKKLVEQHFETAQLRQAESDLNLLKAIKLGEELQRLGKR
jgi:hypothetical protein